MQRSRIWRGANRGSLRTERRRDLLDGTGVICGALSSSALCAGVRPAAAGWTAERLREAAAAAMPCALTLHEIAVLQVLVLPGVVYSCENPEVMAAARKH